MFQNDVNRKRDSKSPDAYAFAWKFSKEPMGQAW